MFCTFRTVAGKLVFCSVMHSWDSSTWRIGLRLLQFNGSLTGVQKLYSTKDVYLYYLINLNGTYMFLN